MTTVSDEGTLTNNLDPPAYDYALATFDRTHYFVANYIWNLPKGGGLLGGGWLARALLDNWTISGISWATSGNPAELACRSRARTRATGCSGPIRTATARACSRASG